MPRYARYPRYQRYRKRRYCSQLMIQRLLQLEYQNRVAKRIDISAAYLSALELGRVAAPDDLQQALADFYGVAKATLFDSDGYSLEAPGAVHRR